MGRTEGQLLIDKIVVETYSGRVLTVVGVVDVIQMGPVDGTQTHGARLARSVNLASAQVERAQPQGGRADGAHLGVGRGVGVQGHHVGRLGHDDPAAGYHGTKGAAALAHAVLAQGDGAAHQFFFSHNEYL